MLELKHIIYAVQEGDGELGILNDISLTIEDHRLVVFTGPNGGGKTTLAKIIMGLVTPTEGQILWMARMSPIWALRSVPVWESATVSSSRPASKA